MSDVTHRETQCDQFFCDTDTVDVKSDKLTVFKPVNNGYKNLTEEILLSLH